MEAVASIICRHVGTPEGRAIPDLARGRAIPRDQPRQEDASPRADRHARLLWDPRQLLK
jgi:hypothetical protein